MTPWLLALVGPMLMAFGAFKVGHHRAMAKCCADVATELAGLEKRNPDDWWKELPAIFDRLLRKWRN